MTFGCSLASLVRNVLVPRLAERFDVPADAFAPTLGSVEANRPMFICSRRIDLPPYRPPDAPDIFDGLPLFLTSLAIGIVEGRVTVQMEGACALPHDLTFAFVATSRHAIVADADGALRFPLDGAPEEHHQVSGPPQSTRLWLSNPIGQMVNTLESQVEKALDYLIRSLVDEITGPLLAGVSLETRLSLAGVLKKAVVGIGIAFALGGAALQIEGKLDDDADAEEFKKKFPATISSHLKLTQTAVDATMKWPPNLPDMELATVQLNDSLIFGFKKKV